MIDANLPRALGAMLRRAGHEATHIVELTSADAMDEFISMHARALGAVILTKDHDFVLAANRDASHPKVVWVRTKNQRNALLLHRLEFAIPLIVQALAADEQIIEIVIGENE